MAFRRHALSAFGAAEIAPPSGFRFPTDAEYATELVKVGDIMASDIAQPQSTGIISPPMQAQVVALRGTLEAVTGLPFGELVGNIAALSAAERPAQIVGAVGELVGGGLNIAADTLEALDVAASAVEIIPIVGQVVSAVFGFLVGVFSLPTREEVLAECMQQLYAELDPRCRRLGSESTDLGMTGVDDEGRSFLSPADMFRPLAYQFGQGGKQYPANVSSLLLMMCGGAAGDFGMPEDRYQELVGWVRAGRATVGYVSSPIPRNKKAGMSLSVRNKLWQLVRAVMTCVQDPRDPTPTPMADQGRTSMPIILDIVRTAEDRGQIDPKLLELLANDALAYTARKRVCSQAKPLSPAIIAYGSCRTAFVPQMLSQYDTMMIQFRHQLFARFEDPPGSGRLRATPGQPIMGSVITLPDVGLVAKLPSRVGGKLSYTPALAFNPKVIGGMHAALDGIRRAQQPSDFGQLLFKLALAAASGYGGYRLARARRWLA